MASTCHRHGADTSLRRLTGEQALTIAGLVTLVVLTLVFDLDVGLVANTTAVVLGLFAWQTQREAVDQSLVCHTADLRRAHLRRNPRGDRHHRVRGQCGRECRLAPAGCATDLLCRRHRLCLRLLDSGARCHHPSRRTLLAGRLGGAIGMVAALAVASTVVDVSPFSTNGALVVANGQNVDRDVLFRRLLIYGAVVTVVAPLLLWFAFVVLWGG